MGLDSCGNFESDDGDMLLLERIALMSALQYDCSTLAAHLQHTFPRDGQLKAPMPALQYDCNCGKQHAASEGGEVPDYHPPSSLNVLCFSEARSALHCWVY